MEAQRGALGIEPEELMNIGNVQEGNRVADLGCGSHGVFVFAAARLFFLHGGSTEARPGGKGDLFRGERGEIRFEEALTQHFPRYLFFAVEISLLWVEEEFGPFAGELAHRLQCVDNSV